MKPLPVAFSRSGTFPVWRTPPTCCPSTGVTTKLLTSLRQCYIGVTIPPLSIRHSRRRNASDVMFDNSDLPKKGEDVSHDDTGVHDRGDTGYGIVISMPWWNTKGEDISHDDRGDKGYGVVRSTP